MNSKVFYLNVFKISNIVLSLVLAKIKILPFELASLQTSPHVCNTETLFVDWNKLIVINCYHINSSSNILILDL